MLLQLVMFTAADVVTAADVSTAADAITAATTVSSVALKTVNAAAVGAVAAAVVDNWSN